MMDIGMIGSGNVATVLSRLLVSKNHRVVQVMSRNIPNAAVLAEEVGASFANLEGVPDPSADIFIVALSDDALVKGWRPTGLRGKPVVHTAGSVSIDVLKNWTDQFGVLYPLQSLRREMKAIPEIPLLIDASDENMFQQLQMLAYSISGSVERAGDEERLKLHTAAVVVNNFTNHLYEMAEAFCKKENVDFGLLLPIIIETAMRIQYISPAIVQTGPALRNDVHTIERHLALLKEYPPLYKVYVQLTESIRSRK